MLPPLKSYDFEVGASCSITLQGKAKTGYPRVSRGFVFYVYPVTDFFLVPSGTFFIDSFLSLIHI